MGKEIWKHLKRSIFSLYFLLSSIEFLSGSFYCLNRSVSWLLDKLIQPVLQSHLPNSLNSARSMRLYLNKGQMTWSSKVFSTFCNSAEHMRKRCTKRTEIADSGDGTHDLDQCLQTPVFTVVLFLLYKGQLRCLWPAKLMPVRKAGSYFSL